MSSKTTAGVVIKVSTSAERFTKYDENNNPKWWKDYFVVQEDGINGSYPKQICFDVISKPDNDKFSQFNLSVGKMVDVSYDIESKPWKDKFITSVTAWKVTDRVEDIKRPEPQQQPIVQTDTPPQPAYMSEEAKAPINNNPQYDLPF